MPADQARDSLHRLHAALDRLTERTFDVELMAELLLGRLALAPQLVSVSALAAELDDLDGIGGLGGAVEVVVDPALLRRVLRDLWHAAAASPRPRARRLEVHRVGSWVELRVVREGAPVEAEAFRDLFEPFDVNAEGPASRSASTWPGRWPPRTAAPSVRTRPTTAPCSGCGSRPTRRTLSPPGPKYRSSGTGFRRVGCLELAALRSWTRTPPTVGMPDRRGTAHAWWSAGHGAMSMRTGRASGADWELAEALLLV